MADQLDPIAVNALLERLANDDAFREQFAASPEEALKGLPGKPIQVPPGSNCMRPRALAGKDQLRTAHATVRARLLGKDSFIPHILE